MSTDRSVGDMVLRVLRARRWAARSAVASTDEARGAAERRLVIAVLTDALQLWIRHHRDPSLRGRRLFAEVDAWFRRADRGGPFAFERICETLDMDARRLRAVLRAYRDAALENAPLPDHLLSEAYPAWRRA